MSYCYHEAQEAFTGNPPPYHTWKATESWLGHYSNSLMLSFLMKGERDARAKIQISKELAIADKRMVNMQRHPNWVRELAMTGAEKLKRDWAGK